MIGGMSKRGGYKGFSHFRVCGREKLPGHRFGNVPDHARCTAHAKSTGKRCENFRVIGQKVCKNHGARGLKPTRAKMLRLAARLRGERPAHYKWD